jgi:ribosome maturation factor RimP
MDMKKSSSSVAATVTKLALPLAEQLGYDLWDVEYVKEGADYYLRITIDSPDGITIDDCEKMHRAIDPVLDEADPIEGFYHLEVSSTGIERELKNEKHINACIGWDVELKLYAPIGGAKTYTGELLGMSENGEIRLSCDPDGVQRAFPRASVASLCTVYHFENDN